MLHKYTIQELKDMGVAQYHIDGWIQKAEMIRERHKWMKYCYGCGKEATTCSGHIHSDQCEKVITCWCSSCYANYPTLALRRCDSPEPEHCCYGFKKFSEIEFAYYDLKQCFELLP